MSALKKPRCRWLQFSLRTLLNLALLAASGTALWRHWPAWSLEHTLLGHADSVHSAEFSPDGRWIATLSGDGSVRIWETEGCALHVTILSGESRLCPNASFSPDSRRIVSGKGEREELWDLQSGKCIRSLEGLGVLDWGSVRYSPDGTRIVTSGNGDEVARIFDAETGLLRTTLRKSPGTSASFGNSSYAPVKSADFSPDGNLVVTAGYDDTARVWEADTGKQIAELRGHTDGVESVSFSPDGRQIVTIGGDMTTRLWSVPEYKELAVLDSHSDRVFSASYSPDSRRIVTGTNYGKTCVWDTASGTLLAELPDHDGASTAVFSPDGKHILTANDYFARVFDAATFVEQARLSGHTEWVHCANYSPDGQRIVTASMDKTAKVWQRNHPEQWWGLACLPEFWLTFLLAGGLAMSIWRDRRKV